MKKKASHRSSAPLNRRGTPAARVKEDPRYHTRVVVKFRDSVDLPYEDGAEEYVKKRGVGLWDDLAREAEGISLRRLFTALRVDQIRALMNRTASVDPSYKAPNLLAYFVVDCPPSVEPQKLAEKFQDWPTVQTAYVQGRGVDAQRLQGPVPNPEQNPLFTNQGYLQPAPVGIGATEVWNQYPGGDGKGVRAIDLEQGWTLDHEDLVGQNVGQNPLHGEVVPTSRWHGTYVLGVICASNSGLGGVKVGGIGIAPNLSALDAVSYVELVSVPFGQFAGAAFPVQNIPNAIMAAIANLPYGDVLVIAQQYTSTVKVPPTERFKSFNVPFELGEPAIFDAISIATNIQGIVVVEAAGQQPSGWDLDSPLTPKRGNSGAILVSAADSQTHAKWPNANYGSRVDCYAWGNNIWNCTSDELGNKTLYTGSIRPPGDTTPPVLPNTTTIAPFGRTSGASAIIAGAAVVAQGIAKAHLGYPLPPSSVRELFKNPDLGTKSANWPNDQIGVMPDLEKIAKVILMMPTRSQIQAQFPWPIPWPQIGPPPEHG